MFIMHQILKNWHILSYYMVTQNCSFIRNFIISLWLLFNILKKYILHIFYSEDKKKVSRAVVDIRLRRHGDVVWYGWRVGCWYKNMVRCNIFFFHLYLHFAFSYFVYFIIVIESFKYCACSTFSCINSYIHILYILC